MSVPQGLSLEYLPPWKRIFGFFRAAPWLAALAWAAFAALGIWQPHIHRLAPVFIAAVHLFTLGALMSVLVAASVQFSAVMTALRIPGEGFWVPFWRAGLWGGAALFTGGLAFGGRVAVGTGVALLAVVLTSYALVMVTLGVRQKAYRELIQAWFGLVFTLLLGWQQSTLHSGWFDWAPLPEDARWTSVHVFMALSAWIGVLIVAVSSRFVPMFFVTPALDDRWRVLTAALLTGLPAVAAVSAWLGRWWMVTPLMVLGAGVGAVWLLALARLLLHRRRSTPDPAVDLWKQVAIVAMVAVVLMILRALWLETLSETAVGALWLWGVNWGVVTAMLFKIVPFLSYLHLQRAANGRYDIIRQLPGMRVLWPPQRQTWLVRLHGVSAGLWALAAVAPLPLWMLAAVCAAEAILLGYAVQQACRLYRRATRLAVLPPG